MSGSDDNFYGGTDAFARFLLVDNNPRDIAFVNDWNERFFWKCEAITRVGYGEHGKSPEEEDNIKRWRDYPFRQNYPGLRPMILGTVGLESQTDPAAPFAVIYYQRDQSMPYYDELGKIQAACEENFLKMYEAQQAANVSGLLKLVSASKRKKAEEAAEELARLVAQTNVLLDRLSDIRRELLGN